MKVVQQLTCLTLGRPNGPAYSTGELLNTPLVSVVFGLSDVLSAVVRGTRTQCCHCLSDIGAIAERLECSSTSCHKSETT